MPEVVTREDRYIQIEPASYEAIRFNEVGGAVLISVVGRTIDSPNPGQEPAAVTSISRDVLMYDVRDRWARDFLEGDEQQPIDEIVTSSFRIIDLENQIRKRRSEIRAVGRGSDSIAPLVGIDGTAAARTAVEVFYAQKIEEYGKENIADDEELRQGLVVQAKEVEEAAYKQYENDIEDIDGRKAEMTEELDATLIKEVSEIEGQGPEAVRGLVQPLRELVMAGTIKPGDPLETLATDSISFKSLPKSRAAVAIARSLNRIGLPASHTSTEQLIERAIQESKPRSIWG